MKSCLKISLAAIALAVCTISLTSCEPIIKAQSDTYWFRYELVNSLQDTILISSYSSFSNKVKIDTLAPSSTIVFSESGAAYGAEDEEHLVIPRLEDGFMGLVNASTERILSYAGVQYVVNVDQVNSFMRCNNYEGVVDSEDDHLFRYTFIIDPAYIETLPKKE